MARIRVGQRAYNAAYYLANRERIRKNQAAYGAANRDKIQASRKGLRAEEVRALLDTQGGRCAICRSALTGTPHIDHDHSCCAGVVSCGRCIRGLLCASCNHMLGKAHDQPDVLEAGAEYLRRFQGGDR